MIAQPRALRLAACFLVGTLSGGTLPAEENATPREALAVSIDFPGGSGEVEAIDAPRQIIRLVPSAHPQRGWDNWWYVHITGLVPNQELTVDVGGGVWATPLQAAVSSDNKTWQQTAPGERLGRERVVYKLVPKSGALWLAWGPPLVLDDARQLVAAAKRRCGDVELFTLCQSRDGHEVPALRLKPQGRAAPHGMVIVARQHAWESGGSWVCRGLLEWLTGASPEAVELRRQAEVVIVPIMDVDNVQRGAGGKQQHPQDHNRDWTDQPHWPEVAAVQQFIAQFSRQQRFDLFLDLHSPGAGVEQPYFYLPAAQFTAGPTDAKLDSFLKAVSAHGEGPLRFEGRTIRTDEHYDPLWRQVSCNWVQQHAPPGTVSACLETPWNTPHSTAEGYMQVGRNMGEAIAQWLTALHGAE